MEVQTLSNLFAATVDPNPNVRKAAELEIRRVITRFPTSHDAYFH